MNDYKFVFLKEYQEANQYGKEQLFLKALAERDAYREVASWKYLADDALEQVDAEAARILEGKK